MFRHLKLLNYLRKINLSLEETAALIRRLETDSCRPEDYEVLNPDRSSPHRAVGGLLGSAPCRLAICTRGPEQTQATEPQALSSAPSTLVISGC